MEDGRITSFYKELEVVAIPEAGMRGAVVEALPEGKLLVDVVNKEGYTLDMLYLDTEPELRVVGRWHAGEDVYS